MIFKKLAKNYLGVRRAKSGNIFKDGRVTTYFAFNVPFFKKFQFAINLNVSQKYVADYFVEGGGKI